MENTKPKHKLYDHPFLGAFVAVVLLVVASNIFAGIAAVISGVYMTLVSDGTLPDQIPAAAKGASEITMIIVAFVSLLIHRLWFRKDGYKGCFNCPLYRNKDVYILLIAAIALDVVLLIAGDLTNNSGFTLVFPTVSTLIIAFSAGIFEETAFRGIPISIMLKNAPTRKRMWIAVAASAAVFGLVHVGNLGAGAAVFATIVQVFSAMSIGLFLAAVYIRTGNIFFTMAYHALHDILGLMDPAQVTGVMTQTGFSAADIVVLICIGAVQAAAGIYLLRKSKWEEIKATWANIWAE